MEWPAQPLRRTQVVALPLSAVLPVPAAHSKRVNRTRGADEITRAFSFRNRGQINGDEISAWRNPAPVGQRTIEPMLVWEA